jgi:hypothetical protein
MKMTGKLFLSIGMILFIELALTTCANQQNWVLVHEDQNQKYFYDEKSLVRESEDEIKVWIKRTFNDEKREELIVYLEQQIEEKSDELSHLKEYFLIDCKKNSYFVSKLQFMSDTRVMHEENPTLASKEAMIKMRPYSEIESLRNAVCR